MKRNLLVPHLLILGYRAQLTQPMGLTLEWTGEETALRQMCCRVSELEDPVLRAVLWAPSGGVPMEGEGSKLREGLWPTGCSMEGGCPGGEDVVEDTAGNIYCFSFLCGGGGGYSI